MLWKFERAYGESAGGGLMFHQVLVAGIGALGSEVVKILAS
jgi:hypothetical protein